MVATKGIKYLLEVAELVIQEDENVEFQIYGEGPEKEKIQEIINEKGLNKNVKLLGYTSTPQQAIRDFKCVLSTSQYEGQGLSMIEAMLLKKPVIAFNIKYGPSEFIINGNNGYLISNFDIKGMANKVLNILNNDDLAEKLGEEARKTIIEKYSSDNLLKKWKMLFDK
ncbi:glycosyltransferase [Staphylococcus saprophyticus]|uniref:glycosyltransferase n=1 Tax=Staphylococcus saprophyticus TaxID=29385 RepID=UPI0021631EE8|nr:glycosyltransferase [Staphylococcus saprophyticus]